MNEKTTDTQACYFLSLEVENVACFGSRQRLDLTDKDGNPARWTVIVGDNAIGKTTLLRCLAGASYSGLDKKGHTMIFKEMGHYFYRLRRDGATNSVIQIKTAHGVQLSDLEKKYREHTSGLKFTDDRFRDYDFLSKHFIAYGYGAARRMLRSGITADKKKFPSQGLFDDDASLTNIEEWLIQADYAAAKQPKYQKYKKQVLEIILNLLPEVTDIDFEVGRNEAGIKFKTPSGWVRVNELGLGYRTMLAWMVDFVDALFERYPESSNPLEEPAILLVDEIDLHLHPKWQRSIIDFLTQRFPNTQFIVTAHSPLLVQSASDANLVLLKRKGNETVIDNNPESVESWRIDQILVSDLFGLESPRSEKKQKLLAEKTKLLSGEKLSTKGKARVDEINRQLGPMPVGETKEEIEADFLLREIAQKLGQRKKTKRTGND